MFETQQLRQNKALKLGFQILVICTGVIAVGATLYVPFHYAAVMPRAPQPETGRLFPIPAQYGGTIYVNRAELNCRNFVANYPMPIFGVIMVLYVSVGTRVGWWTIRPRRGS